MGSAASTGAGAAQGQANDGDKPPSPKPFLAESKPAPTTTANTVQKKTNPSAWGPTGNGSAAKNGRKGAKDIDGPTMFKAAVADGDDDDDDDFNLKRRASPKPKRPLDKTAGSPKRIAERNSPAHAAKQPMRFKDMPGDDGDDGGDVDADVADAVAMAEAAESRRRAKKRQAKKEKKMREEREAHARAEAERFAAEEAARMEEYKRNKAKTDDKWEAIASPQGSPAGSPKVAINLDATNATSPRPKRQLNPHAVKNRVSTRSHLQAVKEVEEAAAASSSSNNNNEDEVEEVGDQAVAAGNQSSGGGPEAGVDDLDAAAIADELLAETSAFGTHSRVYRPPASVQMPQYSNFDNDKFRQIQAKKAESPGGGGGAPKMTHSRRNSDFVPLGRLKGTGAAAARSGSGAVGHSPKPNADSDDEAEDDDEDFMDEILNEADF